MELLSEQTVKRFQDVILEYKSRLSYNPRLRLSDLCWELRTDYGSLRGWCKNNGISIRDLKKEAILRVGADIPVMPVDHVKPSFIRFIPGATAGSTAALRGVNVTFPDGVSMTIQESSVEDVISLLSSYRTRFGGATPCLD